MTPIPGLSAGGDFFPTCPLGGIFSQPARRGDFFPACPAGANTA